MLLPQALQNLHCQDMCIPHFGNAQASGEAMYTYDMPEERDGLYAAFVGSTKALAVIKGIDASEALSMPGVVAVLDARDVPGENKSDVEEVFASKKV